MDANPTELKFDIQLGPGEPLSLPADAAKIQGPGRWQITVRATDGTSSERDHSAFLTSYSATDEGLYDDYSAG